MNTHYDKITGSECTIIEVGYDNDAAAWDKYLWVLLDGKGRPRTRLKSDVITLAERRAQLKAVHVAKPYWFEPALAAKIVEAQKQEIERLTHVCDLQEQTLKFLIENDVVSFVRNYKSPLPTIVDIFDGGYDSSPLGSTPQFVLDVLQLVDKNVTLRQ